MTDFWAALKVGNFPAVSFLKAPAYQDGHAGYSDPLDEQEFVADAVNKLEQSPDWKSTAIVILYDDSDGWYDHAHAVVNPSAIPVKGYDVLNGDACSNGTPLAGLDGQPAQGRCGYGTRQPLLVVSPYAKANYVDHTLTDQSSVTRFIEDNWLGGERIGQGSFDAIAGTLDHMFDWEGNTPALMLDPKTGKVRAEPAEAMTRIRRHPRKSGAGGPRARRRRPLPSRRRGRRGLWRRGCEQAERRGAARRARSSSIPSLSSSGKMACATCHDPAHAYAPANDRAVQLGGPDLDRPGIRTVPSLAYKLLDAGLLGRGRKAAFEEDEPAPDARHDDSPPRRARPTSACPRRRAMAPTSCRRAASSGTGAPTRWRSRRSGPLLSPFEMDNPDAEAVYQKLIHAAYADAMPKLFGAAVPGDHAADAGRGRASRWRATRWRSRASTPSPASTTPISPATATLTPAEARGLKLFDDPEEGQLRRLPSRHGRPPTARRRSSPTTNTRRWACRAIRRSPPTPTRTISISASAGRCATTPMPSRRRIAACSRRRRSGTSPRGTSSSTTASTRTSRDVVRFYVLRETEPEKIYPRGPDGTGREIRRPAAAIPQEYRRDRRAVRPQAGRQAGARRRRDRRSGGVPEDADRRLSGREG